MGNKIWKTDISMVVWCFYYIGFPRKIQVISKISLFVQKGGGKRMYEKFEKLLLEREMTAKDVSDKTGIATSTLSEWKNGKYQPKVDKLMVIAKFFGVPVTYFLE